MAKENNELHLFILWQNSRVKQDEIISDIKKHFKIVKIYEVQWTKGFIASNFTRFYGVNLPDKSFKEKECGSGPFLLIIVEDQNPIYDLRSTSRGKERVNTNMFDAKERYRILTGGGHKIHGTNNPKETNHDLTLLLGKNTADFLNGVGEVYDDSVDRLAKDIEGAHGWNSLNHLFYVINNTTNYVILRGKQQLCLNQFKDEHRDIDLFTDEYISLKYIINGESTCNPHRPHEKVIIEGYDYYFDLWDAKRLYFDQRWGARMLSQRQKEIDYYFLCDEDNFYCLLYHCLIFKGSVSDDYKEWINEQVSIYGLVGSYEDILLNFLTSHNYFIPQAKDYSVSLHLTGVLKDFVDRYGILIKSLDVRDDCGRSFISCVLKRGENYIKIGTPDLIDNEARFLTDLTSEKYFPKLIRHEKHGHYSLIEIEGVAGVTPDIFFAGIREKNPYTCGSFLKECLNILTILSRKGIVHRDCLLPNILVAHDGKKCKVHLIDFGWATYIDEINNTATPKNLGGDYYPKGNCSDFIAMSRAIQEAVGPMPYVTRFCARLWQVNQDDYQTIDHLSKHLDALNHDLNKSYGLADIRYYASLVYWKLGAKYPLLLNLRDKLLPSGKH